MPEFDMILARKIIKIPEFSYLPEKLPEFPNFTRLLPEKCPNFYIIIAQKYFPNFGGHMSPLPRLLRLWPVFGVDRVMITGYCIL